MGEMADMMLDWGWDDDGQKPPQPEDYLDMTDAELRAETSAARSNKIKSIRKWGKPLSEKQRWCLAFWICEHDRKHS